MRKKQKRSIALLLAVIFVLSTVTTTVFAATEDELNAKKDAAIKKRDTAQYQVDMTQDTIDGIVAELDKADAEIVRIETEISTLDKEIEAKNAEIDTTLQRIKKAEQEREKHEKALEERIKAMYMYGNEGYLEVLFASESVGDLIQRIDVIASVMAADQSTLEEMEKVQAEIEIQKKALEQQKSQLAEKKADQESKKADQESIKVQQNQLLAEHEALMAEYVAKVEEENAIIAEAEAGLAEIAAEKQRQYEAQLAEQRRNSSGYIWPSDYTYITSYFGWRESPTYGASSYHQGVDIGANYGSPIYASAAGIVSLAGWNGGYGNCVMISHYDGCTTLYGHQSSIACYEGQHVSKGEVIGYCGSTGVSTGPHVHFSFIDQWGDYVNPLNYVSN